MVSTGLPVLPMLMSSNSDHCNPMSQSIQHIVENVGQLLLRNRFEHTLRFCLDLLDDLIHSQVFQLLLELHFHLTRNFQLVLLHSAQKFERWQFVETLFDPTVLCHCLGQSIDLTFDKCIDQLVDCATCTTVRVSLLSCSSGSFKELLFGLLAKFSNRTDQELCFGDACQYVVAAGGVTPLDGSLLSLQGVEQLGGHDMEFGHSVVNVDARVFDEGGIDGIVGGRWSFRHYDDQKEGGWVVLCYEDRLKIERKG